jgi:hypothetical protein
MDETAIAGVGSLRREMRIRSLYGLRNVDRRKTAGQGHSQPYGRFWDGHAWLAHRWSAINIHGLDITGLQVDHCCPTGPSTLCVEHLAPERAEINRLLQHMRPGRAFQDLDTRRYWIHVQVGIEPVRERERLPAEQPVFLPPAWLRPFINYTPEIFDDGIPF